MGLFDKLKNGAKNAVKNGAKKLIMKILKIIAQAIFTFIMNNLPLVITLVILASLWNAIVHATKNQTTNEYKQDGVVEIADGNQTNTMLSSSLRISSSFIKDSRETKKVSSYKIDENIVKNVNKKLEDLFVDKESIGLTDELILKFAKAEIVTLYPDLRSKDKRTPIDLSSDEVEGCVQFVRKSKENEEGIIMEYKPFKEFQTILAKFGYNDLKDEDGNSPFVSPNEVYKTKAQVDEKYNSELKGYFTLDKEFNLIIARISSTEETTTYNDYAVKELPKNEDGSDHSNTEYSYEYSVDIERIPFQNEIKEYSMPVEFLMSLLMVSQNTGFCDKVADLVKDSKIIIEIHDNETDTNIIEKYDYISRFFARKTADYQYEVITPPHGGNTMTVRGVYNRLNQAINVTTRRPVIHDDQPHALDGDDTPYVPTPTPTPTATSTEPEETPTATSTEPEETPTETPQEQPTIRIETVTKDKALAYTKGRNMENPYKTVVTNIVNTNIKVCLSEVSTWIVDAKAQYIKEEEEKTTTSLIGCAYEDVEEDMYIAADPSDFDLEGYSDVADYHGILNLITFDDLPTNATLVEGSLKTELKEKKDENEQTWISDSKVNNIKYIKSNTEVVNHEERFLSLLKVNPKTNVFDLEDLSSNTKLIKYKKANGTTESPDDNITSATGILFELLDSSSSTKIHKELMEYLLYLYSNKEIIYGNKEFDFSIYEPGDFTTVSAEPYFYGGSFKEKVWFALKSLGISDEAAAGAMGNFERESGYKSNNLENAYEIGGEHSLGYTDETYTEAVDSGIYSLEKFISDHVGENKGAGYGLAQWTYCTRKERLYNLAKNRNVSIADEDMQLTYLMQELDTSSGVCALSPGQGYVVSDWLNATTPEEAAKAFCGVFEKGAKTAEREKAARRYYEEYKGREQTQYVSQYYTSEQAMRMVTWAESYIGKSVFYRPTDGAKFNSKNYCAAFAESAHCAAGFPYLAKNAIDIPHPHPFKYNADGTIDCSEIPIGAYIVSAGTNIQYGHVALYVGNGYVIEAGGKTVVKQKIDKSYGRGKFLGWGT